MSESPIHAIIHLHQLLSKTCSPVLNSFLFPLRMLLPQFPELLHRRCFVYKGFVAAVVPATSQGALSPFPRA